jgi:hypothetical protein
MNKAILGFLMLGLIPIAPSAANEHRENLRHEFVAHEAFMDGKDARLVYASQNERAIAVEDSDRRGFRDGREDESPRLSAPVPHIAASNVTATPSAVAAPEIDTATAVSGLTLLLGAVAVLCGRRTRTPSSHPE